MSMDRDEGEMNSAAMAIIKISDQRHPIGGMFPYRNKLETALSGPLLHMPNLASSNSAANNKYDVKNMDQCGTII